MSDFTLPPIKLPGEYFEALAAMVAERVQERPRIVTIDGLAKELGIEVRQARGLREKGLPAVNPKPLLFDMQQVYRWLEGRRF